MALSNFMPNLVIIIFFGGAVATIRQCRVQLLLNLNLFEGMTQQRLCWGFALSQVAFPAQNTEAIRKGLWYSKRWISLDFVAHHMHNLQNEIGGPNINLPLSQPLKNKNSAEKQFKLELRRLLTIRWLFSCSFLTVSVVFWKIEWGVVDEVVLTDEWSGLLLTDVEEEEPELLLLMVTGWKVTEGPPSNWKQMV